MAAIDLKDTRIRFQFYKGLDGDGKPVFEYKSYSYINGTASADDVNSAAESLAGLSEKTLSNVEVVKRFDVNA